VTVEFGEDFDFTNAGDLDNQQNILQILKKTQQK
jgi:hypothetical protein